MARSHIPVKETREQKEQWGKRFEASKYQEKIEKGVEVGWGEGVWNMGSVFIKQGGGQHKPSANYGNANKKCNHTIN